MPITVLADTAPEWWETVLAVFTAFGTVGAVLVAVLTGIADRRSADRRAEDDRKEFARQQLLERQHEQRQADLRWRLDQLTTIATEFAKTIPAGNEARVAGEWKELNPRVRAYPASLPVLTQYLDEGGYAALGDRTRANSLYGSLRVLAENAGYEDIPDLIGEPPVIQLVQLEMLQQITYLRNALLPGT